MLIKAADDKAKRLALHGATSRERLQLAIYHE